MTLRIVSQEQVRDLLPMHECIDLMRQAFVSYTRGEATVPLRPVMVLPDRRGVLALMPGHTAGPVEALGVKVITVFPGNLGTPLDAHQGAVLLFDTNDGRLVGLMDASEVTAIRTAAASAVATDLLARPSASDLAVLGSGVQARTHLEAMRAVRDIQRVRLWSRSPERARAFAEQERTRGGPSVEVCDDPRSAVTGADLICTTTGARDPIVCGDWLDEGAHVNAVGSALPTARELDTRAVVRARVFVDSRESAAHEAGDLLIPMKEGAIGSDHIVGEIGDVLQGTVAGRTDDRDVTLFKSLGIAVQDVVVAKFVVERARQTDTGTDIEFGGLRDASG